MVFTKQQSQFRNRTGDSHLTLVNAFPHTIHGGYIRNHISIKLRPKFGINLILYLLFWTKDRKTTIIFQIYMPRFTFTIQL